MYKRVVLQGIALYGQTKKLKKGEDVPLKLERESTNPYDNCAIAFVCLAENDWERIGSVVSEPLADVNEAISNNKILKTFFSWINVYYKQPGWYAGILVTRSERWSRTVMQSCKKNY